jgi:exodeoxyribonuclease III
MDVGTSALGLIGYSQQGRLTLRIATWNVNSIRQRIGHLIAYLVETKPDVVCLQELKCPDDAFPHAEVEGAGYTVALHGQKTFNGVAILSRFPMEVTRGLPGDAEDEAARYIEAVISTRTGVLRVASLYAPNGNPPDGEKYRYKLAWMDRLIAHARDLLSYEEPLVLAGDYNVIPDNADVHDPLLWAKDALFLPQTRAKFQALINLGLTDALRAATDAPGLYTFWDYQAGAWPKNNGIRIDHLLLSPQATDLLRSVSIDKAMRGHERPSDHVAVRLDLDVALP